MKKIAFLFVAFVAMTIASCGSKCGSEAANADSTVVAVDSNLVDSTVAVADTVVAE